MSNKEYVRELCAGYSELWALDQLADELDKRDKRIAELEAGLAESCRDMRDEFLGQCPIAGELQARLDAIAAYDLSAMKMQNRYLRDRMLEMKKRIEELKAQLPADSLQAVCDTQKKQIAELEAKIKEGRGPITSWLVDEMNKVRPLQKRIAELEAAICKHQESFIKLEWLQNLREDEPTSIEYELWKALEKTDE